MTNASFPRPADPGRQEAAHVQRLASIGRLTSGIAHEISNPLSVIIGFAQSLVRRPVESAEDLQGALQAIEREATRCKHLVQDLLAFCRSGQTVRIAQDPAAVAEGALTLILTQARLHHVEVVRQFGMNLPWIRVDRHQWQQVLINLSFNAIDAMPKGGTLTISLEAKQRKGNGHLLEMRVQDTGAGIAPEIVERIFEPFFTTKEAGKGTGLGLGLVDQIIREHGGTIRVSSTVGKGAVFIIQLAATAPPAEHAAAGLLDVLDEVGEPDVQPPGDF